LLRLQALEHVRSIHAECAGYGGTTVNQGCEECSALVGGRGSAWREGTPLAFARTLTHARWRVCRATSRYIHTKVSSSRKTATSSSHYTPRHTFRTCTCTNSCRLGVV
jgi:hypothetical protein